MNQFIKIITHLTIAVVICISPFSRASEVPLSIHEVGAKVKEQNLLVQEEAERVYQARQAVKIARTNLLPKLNLWRIIQAVASFPVGLLGLIEDLVPFLMPNNWLTLKQQSLFYQVELQGQKALKANQVFNAKNLYLDTLADLRLYEMIQTSLKNTKEVWEYVKIQEVFGQAPQGARELLEIRMLAFEDDLKSMQQLLALELQTLSQLVGLPQKDVIKLNPALTAMPNAALNVEPIEKLALEISPEIKQFDYMISAAAYIKKTAWFSILGVSGMTRGVANGVFDSIPVQDGLGFGVGSTIAVGRSYIAQIKLQQEGAMQTLSRQVQAMVTSFNLDLDRYSNANQRRSIAEKLYKMQIERLSLGQSVPALELIESLEQGLRARTDALMVETRLRQTTEKVSRITFEGEDYNVE